MSARMPVRKGRIAVVSAVAAVALAGLTACSSDSDEATSADGASSSGGGASQVAITLENGDSGDACTLDTDSVAAGPITFTVTNEDAAGITEVELLADQKILGEKENLAPGLSPVEFTVTLGGGSYQVYCPGAETDTVALTVTGEAAPTPTGSTQDLLAQGAKDYAGYVDTQVAAMVTAVQKLQQAIDDGDLETAQAAYAQARPFYEKIESDVDGFVLPGFDATDNHGNLDYLVDMRASNLDPAVGWHGFHAVERDLFGRQEITASTKKLAAELTSNMQKLSDLVKTLDYKPEDLANGAAGLLEEVQANKITGEEEAFSHIDLVDFAGNVEGAQESFAYLKPGLVKIDKSLTDQIGQRFDSVNELLDTYRDPNALGGYAIYTDELKASDANKLSQSVQALQDSLSRLAEKVATA
jgi:iron uptake system component EfeO